MHNNVLISVTSKEVSELDSNQLVIVLRKLLHAELSSANLEVSSVNVTDFINIPDGGEDGVVKLNDSLSLPSSGYIPSPHSIFQVKASDDLGGDPLDEGGKLKSKVKIAMDDNDSPGHYVMFCNKVDVGRKLDSRLDKIIKGLSDNGVVDAASRVTFLGINKIAEWANRHPSVVLHIKSLLGKPVPAGFQTFTQYASEYHSNFEYEKPDSIPSITRLAEALNREGARLLVKGDPGLGKSRLVNEIIQSIAELPHKCLYVDMGKANIGSVEEFLRRMGAKHHGHIVLYADNCSDSQWYSLQGFSGCDGRLSIVGTGPESIKPTCEVIRLSPDKATVKKLLSQIPELPETKYAEIEKMSEGYVQIISWIKADPDNIEYIFSGRISDFPERLVKTRLRNQRYSNDEISKCIRLLQAISAVLYLDESLFEKLIVSENLNKEEAQTLLGMLIGSEFITKIGQSYIVRPLVLAHYFARAWWEKHSSAEIMLLASQGLGDELNVVLCARLERLLTGGGLDGVFESVCGEGSPFVHAGGVKNSQKVSILKLILSLVPHPDCLIKYSQSLLQIFQGLEEELIKGFDDKERRLLVRLLDSLMWSEKSFEDAANYMLMFATNETEGYANNSTGLFCQRFSALYSGTMSTLKQRLDYLSKTWWTVSGNNMRKVVLSKALVRCLDTYFSGVVLFTMQGINQDEVHYRPASEEIFEYIHGAILLLEDILKKDQSLSDECEAILIKGLLSNLARLFSYELFEPISEKVTEIVMDVYEQRSDFRIQVLQTIADGMPAYGEKWPPKLLELLKPKSLEDRFYNHFIYGPTWYNEDTSSKNMAVENIRALAGSLEHQYEFLIDKIDDLLSYRGIYSHVFWSALIESEISYEHITFIEKRLREKVQKSETWHPSYTELVAAIYNSKRMGFKQYASGVIEGLQKDNVKMMFKILESIEWDEDIMEAVCMAIKEEKICLNDLKRFRVGLWSKVCKNAVLEFYRLIPSYLGGALVLMDFLNQEKYAPNNAELLYYLQDTLITEDFIGAVINSVESGNYNHTKYAVKALYSRLLEGSEDVSMAMKLLEIAIALLSRRPSELRGYYKTEVLSILLYVAQIKSEGSSDFRAQLLELVAQSGLPIWELSSLLGHGLIEQFSTPNALAKIPAQDMSDLIDKHGDKLANDLAYLLPPMIKVEGAWQWHPTVEHILLHFPQSGAIDRVYANLRSFTSTGSRVPYYERYIPAMEELLNKAENDGVKKQMAWMLKQFQNSIKALKEHEELEKLTGKYIPTIVG